VQEISFANRLKLIREACGLNQGEFVALVNARSTEHLSQSKLSRLESGRQLGTFNDAMLFARFDPLERGRAWLAWGADGEDED